MMLRDRSGAPIVLEEQIGSGGEGSVHPVVQRPGILAKMFRRPDGTRLEKLSVMLSISRRQLPFCAWPFDVVRDATGQVVGFLMEQVADGVEVHQVYGPGSRMSVFPEWDWRHLVSAATNLARAVASVHVQAVVIGDINQSSVMVKADTTVKLIDCDSFQVEASGKCFPCTVAVPTYTPPELQEQPLQSVKRTPDHDAFGLAVMVFQLLFMGRHPFAGRGPGDMTMERAVKERHFYFSRLRPEPGFTPPPYALSLADVGPRVTALFERAFRPEPAGARRPTAAEWVQALEELRHEVVRCGVVSSHYHRRGQQCPWCRIEGAGGPSQFLPTGAGPAFAFDIPAAWAAIEAVRPPGPAARLQEPRVRIRQATRGAWLLMVARCLCLVAGLAGAVLAVVAWQLYLVPGTGAFWGGAASAIVGLWAGAAWEPPKRMQTRFRSATSQWQAIAARWAEEAGDSGFQRRLAELRQMRTDLETMPAQRQAWLAKLEREVKRSQLDHYLHRFTIQSASIHAVGPTRKAMLIRYGVDTARGATWNALMSVPGIGDALAANVMAWRHRLESSFRLDPARGVDPRDVATLDQEIARERARLASRLSSGPNQLRAEAGSVRAARESLKTAVENARQEFARAEADRKLLRTR